ncbi:response regulator transcription factor [Archangium violaceum]|uniref:response regulator n=1 Tax=Archangium violaceum TaxID=83451 RepID=UPI002B3090EA|nr:response regulator transcription factor [Archangium violaceum]
MATLSKPIVIVEDDPDIRDAIHALLTEEGYTVVVAPNCLEAQAVLRSLENPCIVLLDLRTSLLHGEQAMHELRRTLAAHSVPVIVATTVLEWSARLEAQVVLKKPFRVDALLEAVEAHCG